MILFFESGRLGNQLFQYFGLKSFFPNHKIIFIGNFSGVVKIINPSNIIYIYLNTKLYQKIEIYIYDLFVFLAKIRLITIALPIQTSDQYSFQIAKGIISNLIFIPKSYFQHYKVVEKFNFDFQNLINTTLVYEAKLWFNKNNITLNDSIAFVHVRRGDYISWPSPEKPSILGIKWYIKAIKLLIRETGCSTIILLGDDPFYLTDLMDVICMVGINNVSIYISSNNRVVDLGIMSLCSHGILSASTFAWWGAFFSRTCFTQSSTPMYIAPTYWAGHRMMEWYPKGFQFDWITYLDVEY